MLKLQKNLLKVLSFQAFSELTYTLPADSVVFTCIFRFHIDVINSCDAPFSMA